MKSLAKELTDQLSQNSMDTAFSDSWKSPETILKKQSRSEERPEAHRRLQSPAAAVQLHFFGTREKVNNRTCVGVWTVRTWRSKRRYQAKKEVMKADVKISAEWELM